MFFNFVIAWIQRRIRKNVHYVKKDKYIKFIIIFNDTKILASPPCIETLFASAFAGREMGNEC